MSRGEPALALSAAATATRRRFADEWRATGVYSALLDRPYAEGLAAQPRDFRPTEPALGRAVLEGRFPLAGAELDAQDGDPWDRPSPSRRLAVELHRFSWLPSLLAEGEAGAREALRLWLGWRALFDRVSPFAWSAEVLERRVYNLACGARRIAAAASEFEARDLAQSLARQARHLLHADAGPSRRAERLGVAVIAGAALDGAAGSKLLDAALPRTAAALNEAVLPDGGLRTRSPEQAMELLFDLMTLDDALLQRGRPAPDEAARAIDRLAGAARFFVLGDGGLARFNGGGGSRPDRVLAALAAVDGEGRFDHAPHSGYHRLDGRRLQVMVDAAPPPEEAWSVAACAQPLAIEVVSGRARLFGSAGWSPDAAAPAALRLTAAASTLSVADASCGRPLTGALAKALGARLVDGAVRVEARREDDETGVWLELAHDGWATAYGVLHQRRLYLDPHTDELRGEDRLTAAEGPAGRPDLPFAVRFHLAPDVRASLARDRRTVLLRAAGDQAWWFRNDAATVALEPSVSLEDGQARRSTQIVLRGAADAEGSARVRWKLAPMEPAAKPVAASAPPAAESA